MYAVQNQAPVATALPLAAAFAQEQHTLCHKCLGLPLGNQCAGTFTNSIAAPTALQHHIGCLSCRISTVYETQRSQPAAFVLTDDNFATTAQYGMFYNIRQ